MSERRTPKGQTNRRWTGSEEYRNNWDRVFGGTTSPHSEENNTPQTTPSPRVLHDFRCGSCEVVFDDLLRAEDPLPQCPECGAAESVRKLPGGSPLKASYPDGTTRFQDFKIQREAERNFRRSKKSNDKEGMKEAYNDLQAIRKPQ